MPAILRIYEKRPGKQGIIRKAMLILGGFILLSLTDCEKKAQFQVTDIDGNVYDAVKIGYQFWMAQNLKTTRLKDGTPIELAQDDKAWKELQKPGYCWYGDNEAFFSLNGYGAIYNFKAVQTGKLCPEGWHVPSEEEWDILISFLGYESAGGKLKATGTRDWQSPNTGATNESGFNALPGGLRNAYYDNFQRFRQSGYFWASQGSQVISVSNYSGGVSFGGLSENDGASVRCITN